MELASKIRNGQTEVINVNGTEIELNSDNLLVTMQGIEGYAFAGEGELGVVLLTHITDELREEGHVREMISKIQNMRKEKDFEVADKINLYLSGNEMLNNIAEKFADVIKKETLTVEIKFNDASANYTEVNINGEKLNMDVEVVK